VHKYIQKSEKVWQTQVNAIYINKIRCNFSATLCFLGVSCWIYVCYGDEDAKMRRCEDAKMGK